MYKNPLKSGAHPGSKIKIQTEKQHERCEYMGFGWLSADSVVASVASRGELKTAGRRTSAPSAVNAQGHQQRALLREKCKENQLDRNGCQQLEKDRSGFDTGQ